MPDHEAYSGIAALSICEALLLALNDAKVLPESEILGVLKDASATHENADGSEADLETHKAVASLINRILSGGDFSRKS
ncbi:MULTISPECIES: hypothetical protein [Falsihalocynthiibacter]|uniref:hypothetical protein n=2 Tax=Roseobacteraceae TaxID=2854170 RepID=UPI003002FAF2